MTVIYKTFKTSRKSQNVKKLIHRYRSVLSDWRYQQANEFSTWVKEHLVSGDKVQISYVPADGPPGRAIVCHSTALYQNFNWLICRNRNLDSFWNLCHSNLKWALMIFVHNQKPLGSLKWNFTKSLFATFKKYELYENGFLDSMIYI